MTATIEWMRPEDGLAAQGGDTHPGETPETDEARRPEATPAEDPVPEEEIDPSPGRTGITSLPGPDEAR